MDNLANVTNPAPVADTLANPAPAADTLAKADTLATTTGTKSIDSLVNDGLTAAEEIKNLDLTDGVTLIKTIFSDDMPGIVHGLGVGLMKFVIDLFLCIVIFFVGRWIIRNLVRAVDSFSRSRHVDRSAQTFLKNAVNITLYVILILTIIQILGISTTSIVAMLASAGLAIGMALSGTLQNFAGGIMILFLKPYRVGDFITTQNESGIVKDIMLFTTVLETPDRHTIFVPNSAISSSVIDNATFADTRRVEWSVGISYGDSVQTAREVIFEILNADPRIIRNPDEPITMPMVGLSALADSSVNLVVRAWVKTPDYWDVFFQVYEQIYNTLPQRGVNFPFPQMDVHIKDKS